MTVTHGDLAVDWLGYATVRLAGSDTVVYVDPGRYGVLSGEWTPPGESARDGHPPSRDSRPEDGDVVCLTHLHHYDPDGVERVAAEDATVLAFEGIDVHQTDRTDRRMSDLPYDVRTVSSEAQGLVADLPFWTVPAYNEPGGSHARPDGTPVHPEGRGCGFLLSIDGTRVFHPGDTDVLEGHAELDVSVFLPPIGGRYTMDRHEAADLAAAMEPDLVVPVHYNTFAEIEADSTAFATALEERGVAVALDES